MILQTAVQWPKLNINQHLNSQNWDTPYLPLTGKLWGVYCEGLKENWHHYISTSLYTGSCYDGDQIVLWFEYKWSWCVFQLMEPFLPAYYKIPRFFTSLSVVLFMVGHTSSTVTQKKMIYWYEISNDLIEINDHFSMKSHVCGCVHP